MKDYLLLLTKYNKSANNEVIKILEKMSEEERKLDRKSFAISLHGLLDHIVEGALYFQKQIWSSFPKLECISHKYSDYKTDYGKINFTDFSKLTDALNVIDNAFLEMYQYLSEEEISRKIPVTSFYGVSNQTVAFIMFQYINHCTHHRGQISQILDEMSIHNDYSGIHMNYD